MSDQTGTDKTPHPMIYAALAGAMRDVQAAPKDGRNDHHKYNYATINAVYVVASAALGAHGVAAVTTIDAETWEKLGQMRLCRLNLTTTFYAADGSHVAVHTIGEGTDTGDKASNKALQAGRKYALITTLNIPAEAEDADSDAPDLSGAAAQPRQQRGRPQQSRHTSAAPRPAGQSAQQPAEPPSDDEPVGVRQILADERAARTAAPSIPTAEPGPRQTAAHAAVKRELDHLEGFPDDLAKFKADLRKWWADQKLTGPSSLNAVLTITDDQAHALTDWCASPTVENKVPF